MIHIVTRELGELADRIEQQFFRIEKESKWASALVNGLIAGSAVAVVAWLVTSFRKGDLLLFACLGSSAAAAVFAPLARINSLRSIIIAYSVASAVCVVLSPVYVWGHLSIAWQCFLAVAVSTFVMRLFDAMHPSAVGSAMAFIIYSRDLSSLLALMLAIVGLLTIVKVLVYIYREELTFRQFPREFRSYYYGTEMTVTVEQNQPAEQPASTEPAATPPGQTESVNEHPEGEEDA